MPKPENQGSPGDYAQNKPNQGQDEKFHTVTNPATGETRQATQREFRDTLKDQGFVKQGDGDDAAADPMPPATPA